MCVVEAYRQDTAALHCSKYEQWGVVVVVVVVGS